MARQADVNTLKSLAEQGDSYNQLSFSLRNPPPNSLIREYKSWHTKVRVLVGRVFTENSDFYKEIVHANADAALDSDPRQFAAAHAKVLGALQAATEDLQSDLPSEKTEEILVSKTGKDIFIVHGHDEALKNELQSFLLRHALNPIVLHRKPDEGLTIIEKFEKHSDVGYAFILLTPDDVGYPSSEKNKPYEQRAKERRARQNVIFEFGYFVGKLSRKRVCCLHRKGVVLPTDVSGMIYKQVRMSYS